MNNSDSGPLWQFHNVSLAGDTSARLDCVSLKIPAGITAIIGYSGAGKTSLLNLLAALEIPDSGSIAASPVVREQTARFSLPTYWVPQSGGLWSHFRAEQHLEAVQAGGIGQNSSQSRESTDNWLARFDLSERRQAYPGQLSRGEQSRLSVARALAANPAVLLMDEPLAHVDPVRTPQYWSVIREHLATTGASLVFSTHEPAVAIQESDHVICLKNGSVTATGPTSEIYHNPPSCEVARFLGPINWFAADEAAVWLGTESATATGDVGLRPENIHLTDSKDGAFEILSFRFGGSYAETLLKHRASSQVRTIIHRPVGSAHHEGQTVGLEVIS